MIAKAMYWQPFPLVSRMMSSFIVSMRAWDEVTTKVMRFGRPQCFVRSLFSMRCRIARYFFRKLVFDKLEQST